MSKKYGKLVRDRIPAQICKNGGRPTTRILSLREFKLALFEKLVEEAAEVRIAVYHKDIIAELADVAEVFLEIKKFNRITSQQIQQARRKARKERGGFTKRIFLEGVQEK